MYNNIIMSNGDGVGGDYGIEGNSPETVHIGYNDIYSIQDYFIIALQ